MSRRRRSVRSTCRTRSASAPVARLSRTRCSSSAPGPCRAAPIPCRRCSPPIPRPSHGSGPVRIRSRASSRASTCSVCARRYPASPTKDSRTMRRRLCATIGHSASCIRSLFAATGAGSFRTRPASPPPRCQAPVATCARWVAASWRRSRRTCTGSSTRRASTNRRIGRIPSPTSSRPMGASPWRARWRMGRRA